MKIIQNVVNDNHSEQLIVINALSDITVSELSLCSLFTGGIYYDIRLCRFDEESSEKNTLIKNCPLEYSSSHRVLQSLIIPKGYNLAIKVHSPYIAPSSTVPLIAYSLFTTTAVEDKYDKPIDYLNFLNDEKEFNISISTASKLSNIPVEDIEKLLEIAADLKIAPLFKGHVFRPTAYRKHNQTHTVEYINASMGFTLMKLNNKWIVNENIDRNDLPE